MYYVISGISLISDEVTRNYYFLQLKNDVVDGKLVCDIDKVSQIFACLSMNFTYLSYIGCALE